MNAVEELAHEVAALRGRVGLLERSERVNFEWLLNTLFRYRRFLFVDWRTYDGWTTAVTGTGAVTTNILRNALTTGATNGSTATSYGTAGTFSIGRSELSFLASINTAVTTSDIWAILTTGTAGGATVAHMGFNIIDGRVWASNGDGGAGTQTDTGIDLISVAIHSFMVLSDSSIPDIKFYLDGALVATHTTNLPAYLSHRPLFYITNTAAADREFRVLQMLFRNTTDII